MKSLHLFAMTIVLSSLPSFAGSIGSAADEIAEAVNPRSLMSSEGQQMRDGFTAEFQSLRRQGAVDTFGTSDRFMAYSQAGTNGQVRSVLLNYDGSVEKFNFNMPRTTGRQKITSVDGQGLPAGIGIETNYATKTGAVNSLASYDPEVIGQSIVRMQKGLRVSAGGKDFWVTSDGASLELKATENGNLISKAHLSAVRHTGRVVAYMLDSTGTRLTLFNSDGVSVFREELTLSAPAEGDLTKQMRVAKNGDALEIKSARAIEDLGIFATGAKKIAGRQAVTAPVADLQVIETGAAQR